MKTKSQINRKVKKLSKKVPKKLSKLKRRRNPEFPEPYPLAGTSNIPVGINFEELAARDETSAFKNYKPYSSNLTVPKTIAFNLGYDLAKEDIENDSWNPDLAYREYIRTINFYLKENKFDLKLADYKIFILGYYKAKLEMPNRDVELSKEFSEIRSSTLFFNPLISDHSKVLKLVYSGYDQLNLPSRKEGFEFSKLLKPFRTKNNVDIASRLGNGDYYAEFIVDNLLRFGYLSKNFLGYFKLTPKGSKIVSQIGTVKDLNGTWNENHLVPKQYHLMSDIVRFLQD